MMEVPGEAALAERHVALARRLARSPNYELAAAEQYLATLAGITAPKDAMRAADLFTAAGHAAAPTQRPDEAESYYAAAIILRERFAAPDGEALTGLRTARLTALYSLGRPQDADQLFVSILEGETDPTFIQCQSDTGCIRIRVSNHFRLFDCC